MFSEQFVFVVNDFRLGVAVFVVLPSVSEQNVFVVMTSVLVWLFSMLMTSVLEQNVVVSSNFYFKLSKNKYSSELINFKIVVAQSIGVLPLTGGTCCQPVLRLRQVVSKTVLGAK